MPASALACALLKSDDEIHAFIWHEARYRADINQKRLIMKPCAVRRNYIDGRWGQLHYREIGTGPEPTLICLHATAYSGQTFAPLMPLLARSRRVIAIDTPGYGESDGPDSVPPFDHYIAALADAIVELEPNAPVDIFGYHTGSLLATGLAARWPDLVRRLMLIGIPFFENADHDIWRKKLTHHSVLQEDFEQFRHRWEFFVTNRAKGMPLQRGFANFVDELKVYPRDFWTHQALFDHDHRPAFSNCRSPSLVINITSPLTPASTAAAHLLGAEIVDVPQLSGGIFDLAPDLLADLIEAFARKEMPDRREAV
jgi:pimeloyl-ACP methyl ester carboxylesterase